LSNGVYRLFPDEGTYTTSVIGGLPNSYSVSPLSAISEFTGLENTDIVDFCVVPTIVFNDLNIVFYPSINDPRPGFDTSYQIVYSNAGTTQLSGDITFQYDDSKIQFLNASETVASQTNNTLTLNYSNLNPFETRTINLDFNVFPPPTTNNDDILVSTITINPVSGDETEEDNTFELEQTVIGSYDPNDIQILEGDEVHIDDANKYLHFLIRFQNTGTASAINVRVEHILDNKLDWTTMQLQSLSHEGRVEITDGSEVKFIFDNINLPDENSNEEGSIGYIAFKIKPKEDVIVGDIISGVADIYFDFNPPIITNTATTEFVEILGNEVFNTKNTISLYPNPANNLLNLKSDFEIQHIEVYDIFGKLILEKDFKEISAEVQINIENLSSGLYLLVVQSDSAKKVLKFIKQ